MMATRTLVPWVILLACACGGGTTTGAEPETAETDETASSAPEEASPDEEESAADEGKPAAAGDESEASGGSDESALEEGDLRSVLQGVLSDRELIDNLHLDKPGRAPLKIAGPNLPAKLQVVAGSHDVKVVDEPSSSKEAVLVFTKIERTGNQVRVHYRFDLEGLSGRASFSLKGGRWELASNRVVTK